MRTRSRAAGWHCVSSLVGIGATAIGAHWVRAGGEMVAVPATLIVLSLVVLTPLAIDRSWTSRGDFVDHHVDAGRRFLTALGLMAAVVIALPAAVSRILPAGSDLWSSVMVLPYLGALVLPTAWSYFATRAAVLAWRGREHPFPLWMISTGVSPG